MKIRCSPKQVAWYEFARRFAPLSVKAVPWDKGDALAVQPDEGESYWQPKPANGYSTVKISPRNCRSNHISFGIQVIAPGGYVCEHWHDSHDEILFCFEVTRVDADRKLTSLEG